MNDMQLLSVAEAAKRLNVSVRTVRNLVVSGKLAHYRIGAGRGVIRISQAALESHLQECEVKESVSPSPRRRIEQKTLRHIKL